MRCLAGIQPLVVGPHRPCSTAGAASEIERSRARPATRVSYVSGDRKKEGIFPNLSIFENLLMPRLSRSTGSAGCSTSINRTKLQPVFEWESSKLAVKMGERGRPDHVALRRQPAEGADRARLRREAGRARAERPGARHRRRAPSSISTAISGTSRRAARRWSSCRARSRSSSTSAPACWCSATARSPRSSSRPSTAMSC